MATAAKFHIDVATDNLLMNSPHLTPHPAGATRLSLTESDFPRFTSRLNDPEPENHPGQRKHGVKDVYGYSPRRLGPYVRSTVLPAEFHPFTTYLCAGRVNVIFRTDGTVTLCISMQSSTFDWRNIDRLKFDRSKISEMKTTCQHDCFPFLNHNTAW